MEFQETKAYLLRLIDGLAVYEKLPAISEEIKKEIQSLEEKISLQK